jgi:hypothetical protein
MAAGSIPRPVPAGESEDRDGQMLAMDDSVYHCCHIFGVPIDIRRNHLSYTSGAIARTRPTFPDTDQSAVAPRRDVAAGPVGGRRPE